MGALTSTELETRAADLHQVLAGMLKPDQIDALVARAATTTTAYPAHGSVWSAVIYMGWQIQVDGGEEFNGKSWGIAFPGGGALYGDVYTDDINALYANTHTFGFYAAMAYTSLYFFDEDHNLLGTFQAGSVSTVGGEGGGSGSWS